MPLVMSDDVNPAFRSGLTGLDSRSGTLLLAIWKCNYERHAAWCGKNDGNRAYCGKIGRDPTGNKFFFSSDPRGAQFGGGNIVCVGRQLSAFQQQPP